jgi:hypothetical protein
VLKEKAYSITFDGDLRYNAGNVTLIINDKENNEKLIRAFIFDTVYPVTISAFPLIDQSGIPYEPLNLKFNNEAVLSLSASDFEDFQTNINLTINQAALDHGLYQGWMFITTTDYYYPVKIELSTLPLVNQVIILVLMGVISSVWVWEVIKYSGIKKEEKKITDFVERSKELDVDSQTLKVAAAESMIKIARARQRVSQPGRTGLKILISEFVISVLIIFISLVTVFPDEKAQSVLSIGMPEVIYFLALGLAAGSLKELIDK